MMYFKVTEEKGGGSKEGFGETPHLTVYVKVSENAYHECNVCVIWKGRRKGRREGN